MPDNDVDGFDPRRLLAASPVDEHCTYTHDSVTAPGWSSVLFRVGHRNDDAGMVDIAPGQHPRVMITQRGSADVRHLVDGRREPARLAPGRSWLVPPGQPLSYEWSGATDALREVSILVLPRHDLEEASTHRDREVRWESVTLVDDGVVGAVMGGIRHALGAGVDDLYAQTASAFLSQHLLTTYGSPGREPVWPGREDARVRAVTDYLQDNLQQSITLADMAEVAGLSRYHFLRVFRATTGETPRRHLARLRVDAARRRLADPTLPITEVAALCGFATASHLSTAFRRSTGLSPSEYRRQLT